MPLSSFVALCLILLGASPLIAQVKMLGSPTRPKMGDVIGPLILQDVERTNGWIEVAWDPKAPSSQRRIGDKTPGAEDDHLWLMIQLDFIGARVSSDPVEEDAFRMQYNEGVKTLLSKQRTFWFQVTNTRYAGPGQIGGVFILDDPKGMTIQQEMLRCGYAVKSSREPQKSFEEYGGVYEAKLRGLEGEARAHQLGVWAPRPDPALLPSDKAFERLATAAQDSKQPQGVREKAIVQLFREGDQNKILDLAIMLASTKTNLPKRAAVFCHISAACRLSKLSDTNRRKYLEYAYGLLEAINDGRGGGYFLAMDIGSCIGVKPITPKASPFTPDAELPQYHDALGNLKESYFQETVNNALAWWREHHAEYQH